MSTLGLLTSPVFTIFMSLKQLVKLMSLVSVFLACQFYGSASFAVMVPPSDQSLQTQIEFIDQEILLLRAELAQSNQDIPSLQRYLKQINAASLAPVFEARFAALTRFFENSLMLKPLSTDQPAFRLPIEGGQVIVLLPLSGDYGEAGQSILEGLTASWPFNKSFTVIDSGLYHSMNELWELVKLYEPDFIIGPLNKENAQVWQALDSQVPTLYLNQLDDYHVYEKGLSPSKRLGLLQLQTFIESMGLEHVLVLADQTDVGKRLQVQFEQAWLKPNTKGLYESVQIGESVHSAMKTALNVQRSISRKNWVQKTIGQDLNFEPRARQDLEAVINLTSIDEAIQIKPILDFYHLSRTFSLWYPTTYPSSSELQSQQNSWQQTYGFLPPYLVEPIVQSSENDAEELKTGLFYALGMLVANIVNNPRMNLANQHLKNSALGQAITNKQNALIILPNVFWLDDYTIQPVNEYQYPFD